jgi:hypothetical protein
MSITAEPFLTKDAAEVVAQMRRWLERAVIGLNLCPFAKPAHLHGRIRFAVSDAETEDELIADLESELTRLHHADPQQVETTLLIHPQVLSDFIAFNDFLDPAEALLEQLDLVGELQVASFHPQFQFGDAPEGAIENCTNRAPYATLHLLREASIERAVEGLDDPDEIYRRNIRTLQRLGPEGWRRLWIES